jgi:hypothetical protein
MAETGWGRPFDCPIPLPDGGGLRTLRDAGNCIAKIDDREAAQIVHRRSPGSIRPLFDERGEDYPSR